MANTVASGTQSAILNTEHTLTTQSIAGTYVLIVDTANMAAGDMMILRVKTKVSASGAVGLAYRATYKDTQQDGVKLSIPVPSDLEFVATLEQISGVARSFDWKVMSL